jgi:hypothetical protein
VRVDGLETTPPLAFVRSRRIHRIEVSAEGFTPWRIEHPATEDGTYRVELVPKPDTPIVSVREPEPGESVRRDAIPPRNTAVRRTRVRAVVERPTGERATPAFFDSPGF